jgi:organic hydroperoxide reductase OsmC/OhrA
MSGKQHIYPVRVSWTGNDGDGTRSYRGYRRDHVIAAAGKPAIDGSSDPKFRGDASRYNPEELLVAALSSCHMLSYLHLCAVNQVVVVAYEDDATGFMEETAEGGGRLTKTILKPKVTITPEGDAAKAKELHHEAHRLCFIANSVNFPVETEPVIMAAD